MTFYLTPVNHLICIPTQWLTFQNSSISSTTHPIRLLLNCNIFYVPVQQNTTLTDWVRMRMKITPNCKYWRTWVYRSECVSTIVVTVLNVNLLNTYGSTLKRCKQNIKWNITRVDFEWKHFLYQIRSGYQRLNKYSPQYVGGGKQGIGHQLWVKSFPLLPGNERRRWVGQYLRVFRHVSVNSQRDHRYVHLVPGEFHVIPRVVRQVSF